MQKFPLPHINAKSTINHKKTLVIQAITNSYSLEPRHQLFERTKQIIGNIKYSHHPTEKIVQDRLDKHFKKYQLKKKQPCLIKSQAWKSFNIHAGYKTAENLKQQHFKALSPYKKVVVKTCMNSNEMSFQLSTRRGDGSYFKVDRSNMFTRVIVERKKLMPPIMDIRLINCLQELNSISTLKVIYTRISKYTITDCLLPLILLKIVSK